MRPGSSVEVRCRFDGGWAQGFHVAAVEETGEGRAYRLRRTSDGWVLPVLFPQRELREPFTESAWSPSSQ